MTYRERLVTRIHARLPPVGLEQVVAAWRAARRRPEAVLAVAFVGGVVVMILHWW